MNPIDHAAILVPLLSTLQDDSAFLEFNFTYPDDKYQALQLQIARFREYPYEALSNILSYAKRTGSKVSFAPNSRRRVNTVNRWGFQWDGFGTKEDVHEATAFFVDADRKAGPVDLAELEAYRPAPTVIVQSSHAGKYHAYWQFRDSLPIENYEDILKYEAVNRGLANELELDVSMDLRRIMRLPGSLNTKYDPPVMCKVVHYDPSALYDSFDQFPMTELSHHHGVQRVFDAVVLYEKLTNPQYESVARQLTHPQDFGGRNNCIYAVAKWIREIGLSFDDCAKLIEQIVSGHSMYHGFPTSDRESAIKSAYRR